MSSNTPVQAIVDAFTRVPESVVDGEVVRQWLESDDLEMLGAACHSVTESGSSERIKPPLEFMDYQGLMFRYGALCLQRADAGEWSDSR